MPQQAAKPAAKAQPKSTATAKPSGKSSGSAKPAAKAHGKKAGVIGGDRNLSLAKANKHQHQAPGKDADHNRLGTVTSANKDTAVYDDQGKLLAPVKAGTSPVRINAGQICRLRLQDGRMATCVLCFSVPTQAKGPDGSMRSGWMLLADLGDKATQTKIRKDQKAIKSHIEAEFDTDKLDYAKHVRTVQPTTPPAALAASYVYPRQTGPENLIKYYYCRNGVVNLLFNLPHTGGDRFGVAGDVVQPGTKFHAAKGQHADLPIYAAGKNTPMPGKEIRFLFGYVVNSAGQKRHGWINEAILGKHHAPGKG